MLGVKGGLPYTWLSEICLPLGVVTIHKCQNGKMVHTHFGLAP